MYWQVVRDPIQLTAKPSRPGASGSRARDELCRGGTFFGAELRPQRTEKSGVRPSDWCDDPAGVARRSGGEALIVMIQTARFSDFDDPAKLRVLNRPP